MRVITYMLFLALALSVATQAGAASVSMALSVTVLSKNQCKFNTTSATLDFGDLDPAASVPLSSSTTLTFVCRGSDPVATYLISDDNGLYSTGPGARRMQHTTQPGAFIPYGLSYTPSTGSAPRNVTQTLNVTATLAAGSYTAAPAGSYVDTVILTIAP